MAGYNNTTIVGNVGKDVTLRYTTNNIPVADFSVAVTKRTKGLDGGVREKTTWFKVTVWRQLAEWANQYVAKGQQVLVTGEVGGSAYMDKKTNEPAFQLELDGHVVQLLGKKPDEENLADVPF